MINYVVAFGLLLAIMMAFAALVRGAPTKVMSAVYSVFFSMILVGASFPALVEVAPVVVQWVSELAQATMSVFAGLVK